ncbi:2569_t:CDS:2, partial [Racocetra fulgida]
MTSGPADARFLTPEERKFALDRLRPEGGPAPVDRATAKKQIKLAFQDIKVYIFLILLFLASIPFNALNLFLPTLVKQLGYSSVNAQLMSVPPLLVATRNITIAAILTLANAGGIVGSLIYPDTDARYQYIKGNIVCLAAILLQCLLTIGLKIYLEIINKQRDLATLTAKNYKIDNELMKNKTKLSEVAKKLVENEPRFDEI